MPIFFQQDIDADTRLAIWKIEEAEDFFLQHVPLQREITHPHKRLQHLAGRFLLKYLFPDFPIALIRVADTKKPYLEDEAYHFSISHCGHYAAAIVSRSERVGVDVELPSPKINRIRHKFLNESELKMLDENTESTLSNNQEDRVAKTNNIKLAANTNSNPSVSIREPNSTPQTPNAKLTLLWCCKEAVFKWWSYGKVDFSEKIKLQPFELQPSGNIPVQFLLGKQNDLILHYTIFDEICLAWIKT
jgi:phosphopantetheinyl transferase